MTSQHVFFLIFSALVVTGAVSVLVQRNPLYSAFSLITTFVGLACLYVLLGAQFLGVVQIVVYAGAIMMLFVFVIMLLNVREDAAATRRNRYLLFLAPPLGVAFFLELMYVIARLNVEPTPGEGGTVERIGAGLLTQYLLPFEATSVLILMAVVGALHLAKREKE
jgi:NADH-quinone oxidoreductase subunit J